MKNIIKPKIKNFICTSVNPFGCEKNIKYHIKYIKNLYKEKLIEKKNVLILGSSSGYGLLSSLIFGFGYGYNIINVFNERCPDSKKLGTFGWYNSFFCEKLAKNNSVYLKNFNCDVFSINSIKEIIKIIKNDFDKIDFLIYSIATSKYICVFDNKVYKSVLKPVKKDITIKDLDLEKYTIKNIKIKKATHLEIKNTKRIMGGFFWQLWIENLIRENVINEKFKTIAYSYDGVILNKIYRNGTIGLAKKHLLKTSKYLNKILKNKKGKAFISYNEAMITQSSVAIPGVSLYLSILNNLKKGFFDKDAINNMKNLFKLVDNEKKIELHLNNFEKNKDVQKKIQLLLKKINSKNFSEYFNIHEFKSKYLKIYGY